MGGILFYLHNTDTSNFPPNHIFQIPQRQIFLDAVMMKVIPEEKKPLYPKRIRMTPMEDDQDAQEMPMSMPPVSFRPRQRSSWDMVTPFTSHAPPLVSPPLRMRPRPNPSDAIDCLPNDIERLSLPVLTAHDLSKDPIKTAPMPINIIKRRMPSEEFCRSVCGKRTRHPGEEETFCKSATFQYPGISGRTIYADPISRATDIHEDDIITTCSDKEHIQEEDFYFPMPRFTAATRSALPHVLQLSK